ncbi:DUF4253 domain-containing protein [Actinoplanes sp. NPDC051861]|uniref:DUF4253 domain-containing protein n=1 Tax=Actinoplanes sp. NPDC051861 TaxID=3155170 RepID=UPI0034432346
MRDTVRVLWDLRSAFRRTPLARKRLKPGPKGTIVVPGIDPGDSFTAWQAAAGLVERTGRWPVLVTSWTDEPLWGRRSAPPDENDLLLLDRVARQTDPWWRPVRPGEWPVTAEQTPYLARGLSGVDFAALRVPPGISRDDLNYEVYQQVLDEPLLVERVVRGAGRVVTRESWFTPENVSLLLLPTASPWLAPAWVSYHGTLGMDNVLAAVLWQWHERWDAKLVACWDTMLQFTLGRRPAPGVQAWELAGQVKTMARSLDINRWELAVLLSHADTLFLHDRP